MDPDAAEFGEAIGLDSRGERSVDTFLVQVDDGTENTDCMGYSKETALPNH
jgi:hypothetical protein